MPVSGVNPLPICSDLRICSNLLRICSDFEREIEGTLFSLGSPRFRASPQRIRTSMSDPRLCAQCSTPESTCEARFDFTGHPCCRGHDHDQEAEDADPSTPPMPTLRHPITRRTTLPNLCGAHPTAHTRPAWIRRSVEATQEALPREPSHLCPLRQRVVRARPLATITQATHCDRRHRSRFVRTSATSVRPMPQGCHGQVATRWMEPARDVGGHPRHASQDGRGNSSAHVCAQFVRFHDPIPETRKVGRRP